MDRSKAPTRKGRGGLRVAELFAGVGGFHLGLAEAGMDVVWANQWEPGTRKQHAFDCYKQHFDATTICVNEDIAKVLDLHDAGALDPTHDIPTHDLLCGGFPCQDYSVARPLSQAAGIEGKKGVLWWQINRWIQRFHPPYLFLENVDRMLKSPVTQRGRDFAVILSCLGRLDYEVEWRVINAADYGFPQKRRRVYIVARHKSVVGAPTDPVQSLLKIGILATACPARPRDLGTLVDDMPATFSLHQEDWRDPGLVSRDFNCGSSKGVFLSAGLMRDGKVWTMDLVAKSKRKPVRLVDILEHEEQVPDAYRVTSKAAIASWRYLKGPKREKRVEKKTGFEYYYAEGGIPFPDPIDRPSRTILTGEGGATPSRFKHLIDPTGKKRYRRLTPRELERLNGFPDDWTATGMPDGRRAFCMGNALVVGVVEQIGREIAKRAIKWSPARSERKLKSTAGRPASEQRRSGV